MVQTESIVLPSVDELNVNEVNLTYPVLKAAAFHLGKYCEFKNNEFMLCKCEQSDPRECIEEGKLVTACTLDFFKQLKKHCKDEFSQYYNCIDKASFNYRFNPCRKTQSVFDKCVLNNLNIERPMFGYYAQVKVHDSSRPKPKYNIIEFPVYAAPVSRDEPLLPPKYNSRRLWSQ
ncbi:PREDICTED: NADH dehydrogenase [ubiquinone] 1 alpha subcomplex subunit 8 [Ceratosolen solmsi marchali]|uniref:NADH dehydrogenase [ubiquinone] 1 alpha subcomplex subunit 8 n=1 Tax=Ceratosolen solmsi marchali TaxID=326594 RepID=A0AAJ7E0Z8_9HYME|nr:PREDICTED: NADH dehydrogenase [ubiquinone] 1 alpha subcomplex subunit 8 [Ceratosolen solmsi marchali]